MQLEGAVIGGDFRLERELAKGGMGGVWLAEQLSTGQKRALKLMHPTLIAEPRMRERFEQEARIGGQIPSAYVVEVIAAGVDANFGIPWLAMELLHGEDLAQLSARRGPLPFSELLVLYRQLCHALGAAHAARIVHRDIKPENVFLAEVHSAEATQQVKVLDFGIAKLAADARDSATGRLGTPLWMAPEQSDPRAHITPATDVWALGLVAFRLLVGRYYWHTANDPSAALSALLMETLTQPIVPASERAHEYGLQGVLPPGFDAWFAHTVARDPAQRYPDAHAAFAALELLAGSTLASAVAPTSPSFSASVPAVSFAPAPSAPAPSAAAPSGALPSPPRTSKAPLFIALGGGLLLLGGLLIVGLGAGAWLYSSESGSDRTSARAGTPPLITTDTTAAPVAAPQPSPGEPTQKSAANRPRGVAVAPGALPAATNEKRAEPTPAPSAPEPAAETPAAGKLAPIDVAAVKKKVDAAAASASVACAGSKAADAGAETYTGSCGFRPDGTASRGMSGGGGAQKCVRDKMFSLAIGKYAHPEEWHVEVFPWTVTVK